MLSNFLYNIDPSLMVLGLLFVIFFAIINFALSKTLKDRGTSSIISFCVSLLIVYGINRTGFDVSGLFYKIGISDKILYSVIPIIIVIGLIYAIWKLKLRNTLMITGIILMIASFFVYKKSLVLIIGIILLVLGILLWIRYRRKGRIKGTTPGTPSQGSQPQRNQPRGPSESEGKSKLIGAAKKFNSWARGQQNPKFVGSWANFVNYLKRGGWGGSEAEICANLGISEADFVNIFQKYGLVN